ncbi:hypothetical protein [Streptomyces sp. F63]|uniref:hypothetical protein n=1 Tax=Streptomyces sp. F63 TaxID=2824887 RepID=UPI001FFCF4DF|nr:hypothetical protein [Streptomyces sp. F63]
MQLTQHTPFRGWDVAGRYCDGTSIAQEDLDRHLQAAHDLIAAHERARFPGTGSLG